MLLEAGARSSVWRTAWCRPAVHLNGERRGPGTRRGTRPARPRSGTPRRSRRRCGAWPRRRRPRRARPAPASPAARAAPRRRSGTRQDDQLVEPRRAAAAGPSSAGGSATSTCAASRVGVAVQQQVAALGDAVSAGVERPARCRSAGSARRSVGAAARRAVRPGSRNGPTQSAYGAGRWSRVLGSGVAPSGRCRAGRGPRRRRAGAAAGGRASRLTWRATLAGSLLLTGQRVRLSDATDVLRRQPMPYYRSVGEIPRKRHTQFRQPDGGLYAEELMGVEGFSSDSVAALPPAPADGDRRRPRRSTPPVARATPNHPLKPRHFQTHKLDARVGRRRSPAGSTCSANDDVPDVVRRSADTPIAAVPQRGRRRVRVRRVGAARRRDGVRRARRSATATTSSSRRRPRTVGARPGEPLRLLVDRGVPATSGRRGATCPRKGQFLEHSPYCERDLRGPAEPLRRRRRGRRGARPAPAAAGPVHLRPPPVRRGRLGRLPLPVRVQRSTTSSRSPAGCTSRRRCTRPSRGRTS